MSRYLAIAFLLCTTSSYSAVRLPKVLSSHMVLQQNSNVKIWGWAEPGETVQVHGDWSDEAPKTVAGPDGRWHVEIKPGTAGGPHAITIEGTNRIILDDVLFGEVWLASGQSNMEMPLVKVSDAYTGIKDADKEVASAKYPLIRLFQVGNFSSKEPLEDVESGIEMYGVPPAKCQWQSCQPDTIPTFSSTAFFLRVNSIGNSMFRLGSSIPLGEAHRQRPGRPRWV